MHQTVWASITASSSGGSGFVAAAFIGPALGRQPGGDLIGFRHADHAERHAGQPSDSPTAGRQHGAAADDENHGERLRDEQHDTHDLRRLGDERIAADMEPVTGRSIHDCD